MTTGSCNSHSDWCSVILQSIKCLPTDGYYTLLKETSVRGRDIIALMNSQYINQRNQSTVDTVNAITNMFFKQKVEVKHMHTKVVVKIFVCLPEVLCPRQHNKCHVELDSEPTHTVLGQA